MLRFDNTTVGVLQGEVVLFSAFEDDGPMWTGSGPRMDRTEVRFTSPFRDIPVVHVGLAMWDIAGDSNQRVDIAVDQVTKQGFDIVFRSWGDTRVARVRANWLAIGSAGYDDDFELE